MDNLGLRIKMIRKDNKLTQLEFGNILGISQTHVSKIEKNIEHPSETLLRFIAHIFNVDLVWIKTGENSQELQEGGDAEGCFNRYKNITKDIEKNLQKMNVGEMYYTVQALFCVRELIISNSEKIDSTLKEDYLNNVSSLLDKMWILSIKSQKGNSSTNQNLLITEIIEMLKTLYIKS